VQIFCALTTGKQRQLVQRRMDEHAQHDGLGEEQFRTGSNQSGMRNYNERLIIDTVRRSGPRSKADIARMTQLSAQTVTVIVNRLIADRILMKMGSIKGKVGQPSTPIAINPDGAVSIGVKVGRRSVDLVAVNFTYDVIGKRSLRYAYPDPRDVLAWLDENLSQMLDGFSPSERLRTLGIGIAIPTGLDGWDTAIDAPEGAMSGWSDIDLVKTLNKKTGLPVYVLNDASAACLAQLTLADLRTNKTFLYIYVATFVGGGLVINGELFEGRTGNSGAIGSMPVAQIGPGPDFPAQVIDVASLHRLEATASANGLMPNGFEVFLNDPSAKEMIANWIDQAAPALAKVIVSAQSILDLDHVVMDGGLPKSILDELAVKTRIAIQRYNTEGIAIPEMVLGGLGSDARALGASILPLRANFSVDQAAFLIGN
jgi:predicted NBD/HSP70 family sugar kinase